MSKEDETYTLQQIRIAFSRHLRNGGELTFRDSYSGADGTVIVNWNGFLKELEHAKEAQVAREG